jgi:dethiobiotin synthetase
MSGVFVGGTDTGCGKTSFARALAAAGRARGWTVRALKPIETGCAGPPGARVPADALAIARAAADRRDVTELCPYRLELAAAPAVAAAHEGVRIDVDVLRAAHRRASEDADLVIVEAAGGLLVPAAPGLDMAALAAELELPLVLVGRARIGTINHTLLSIREAQRRGLRLLGLAISHTEPELSKADRANLDWLIAHLPAPFLGELPYVAQDDGNVAASGLALDALFRALDLA